MNLGLSRRIWVTEVGVTTVGPWSNPIRVGNLEDAAYFLTRIYERLRDEGAKAVIVHRFRDHSYANEPLGFGLAESAAQEGAGVLFWDFACKPAFDALAQARGVTIDCAL